MKGISAIREICVQKTMIPCETNTLREIHEIRRKQVSMYRRDHGVSFYERH